MKLFRIGDYIRYMVIIGVLYFVFIEVPIVTAIVITGLSISNECHDLLRRLHDRKHKHLGW